MESVMNKRIYETIRKSLDARLADLNLLADGNRDNTQFIADIEKEMDAVCDAKEEAFRLFLDSIPNESIKKEKTSLPGVWTITYNCE